MISPTTGVVSMGRKALNKTIGNTDFITELYGSGLKIPNSKLTPDEKMKLWRFGAKTAPPTKSGLETVQNLLDDTHAIREQAAIPFHNNPIDVQRIHSDVTKPSNLANIRGFNVEKGQQEIVNVANDYNKALDKDGNLIPGRSIFTGGPSVGQRSMNVSEAIPDLTQQNHVINEATDGRWAMPLHTDPELLAMRQINDAQRGQLNDIIGDVLVPNSGGRMVPFKQLGITESDAIKLKNAIELDLGRTAGNPLLDRSHARSGEINIVSRKASFPDYLIAAKNFIIGDPKIRAKFAHAIARKEDLPVGKFKKSLFTSLPIAKYADDDAEKRPASKVKTLEDIQKDWTGVQ